MTRGLSWPFVNLHLLLRGLKGIGMLKIFHICFFTLELELRLKKKKRKSSVIKDTCI